MGKRAKLKLAERALREEKRLTKAILGDRRAAWRALDAERAAGEVLKNRIAVLGGELARTVAEVHRLIAGGA